jgi:Rps23 Pro-64 3,4-dihydroxylase Tpa1-like proline 4-hydroxylase
MSFSLSISLDGDAIRQDFERQGYVQIADVLLSVDAERIYKTLLEDTPWNLVFTDRGKHFDLSKAHLDAMDKQQIVQLQQAIYAQAQNSFQYCYNNYPIFDAYRAGENKGHILHEFYEWLNDDEFLGFTRTVTGFDDISFLDAQASRYKPGHFLTTHDDSLGDKNRRAAYIFGFTPNWPADWGGFLQLLDEKDNIRHGLRPAFNSLNVLAVPQKHSVSLVAPFAGGMRMSITGWLRYGDPK